MLSHQLPGFAADEFSFQSAGVIIGLKKRMRICKEPDCPRTEEKQQIDYVKLGEGFEL